MGTKILNAYGVGQATIPVMPPPIQAQRAPVDGVDVNFPQGQLWFDNTVDPPVEYTFADGASGTWSTGGNEEATTSSFGIVQLATLSELQNGNAPAGAYVPTSNDVATVIAGIVVGAVPPANETQAGIAEIATQVETDAGLDDTRIVTPLKLATFVAGGGGAGSFTDLTATGTVSFTGATGAINMTSATASSFTTTGAGIDLTLDSAAGQLIMTGGEAAANAVRIQADNAAGGIDVDAGSAGIAIDTTGAISIDSAATSNLTVTGAGADLNMGSVLGSVLISATEDAALAIRLHANGGTSETIQIHSDQGTGVGSINLLSDVGGVTIRSTGLASNDAINLEAAAGGIDIDAALQINVRSTQSAASSIVVESTAGGIDILASGAAAGEDIDIVATGSSVNISATENDAGAITIGTNGGTSERITVTAAQGTNAASIGLASTAGGITLTAGLATADAINLVTSNAGGGIDIDAGTAGFIVDTTGAISLDAAAASNFTATGAFDITVQSTAGSININAGEAAADAINMDAGSGGLDVDVALQMNLDSSQAAATAVRIVASNAAGGIDIDAGTGGITVDTTGVLSLDSAGATNLTATGAFDITVQSTAGSVNILAGESAADSIVLNSAAGGIDILASGAAAGEDIDIIATGSSVNISATESAADSITIISTAGGIDISASGAAAGEDIDITATGSSINITATENVTDAIVINASGAASALQLDAGTGSIRIGSGLVVPATAVNNGMTPYTVLGTDYFLAVDSSAGVVTVTLPAATALAGRTFVIRDVGGAAAVNNITIGGGGTNLVGGGAAAATKVLSAAYSGATVISDGTIWAYAYVA